jgi:GTP-binding protein
VRRGDGRRAPDDQAPRIAIVGRPNAGKSSLFNRLVGEDRAIVHETPGTTRDAVDTVATVDGRAYRFVDTAGMRRKVRRASGPEYYGLVRSLRALDDSDAAILVVDAAQGPTEQDQKIAERIAEAGRAAVIALNKWDLVEDSERTDMERDVRQALRFVSWAPLVRTSALTGRGLNRVMPAVGHALESWNRRVTTAELNAWLRTALAGVPLHRAHGSDIKVKYATQARTRPPELVLFTTGPLSDTAKRTLERRFRKRFPLEGSPLRIVSRAREPRYAAGR